MRVMRIVLVLMICAVVVAEEAPVNVAPAPAPIVERLRATFASLIAERNALRAERDRLAERVRQLEADAAQRTQDLRDAGEALAIVQDLTVSMPFKERLTLLYGRALVLVQERAKRAQVAP
jgi:hypothetical protein